MDNQNQEWYARGTGAGLFDSLGRWLDFGEQAAIGLIAAHVRDQSVLDVGIGAGRTPSLLRLLTDDYVGIDYSKPLVERAKKAHPDLDLREGDARDLASVFDKKFALVLFSYNGIDTVSRRERSVVLSQIGAVLSPGGYFVYSTLNKRGHWFNEAPWRSDYNEARRGLKPLALVLARVALRKEGYRRRYVSWWRMRHEVQDFGDWGIGPLGGPGTGLTVHWTTPSETRRELSELDFEVVAMYESDGSEIAAGQRDAVGPYFHVVARCLA